MACTEGSRQLLIRSRDSLTVRASVYVTACQSVPFLCLLRPQRMPLLRHLLAATGATLLVIAVVDLSLRAAVAGAVLLAAAYAVHRRVPAFWWVACLFLVVCFVQAVRDVFRGPQTPLAIMCSILAILFTALIASWWSRQKQYFGATHRNEV